jgi:adenylosuccinate lyase
MPHKVNPIDFENAEGNLGLANALLAHLGSKLPVSRLQRDLSDSTVLRSLGVPMGHSVLALMSAQKGLQKCSPNLHHIQHDLDSNAVVIAEAYQVILRREGVANGYEIIKAETRTNLKPTLEDMRAIINKLPVNEIVKEELRAITPENYTGIVL